MSTPDSAAIIEAMRSDLSANRVNDLELENGRPGRSMRPRPIFEKPVVVKMPAASRKELASKWQTAINQGEFDDDDAEAVKGLARIGGGRLHAQNNGPAAFGQNAVGPNFFPPPPSLTVGSYTTRTPGAFQGPPTTAPGGRRQALDEPSTTAMGAVPNGPVMRFVPGRASPGNFLPAATSQRTKKVTPPVPSPAKPSQLFQNFATENSALNMASTMPPTPPQDSQTNDQAVLGKDEPKQYYHKADIKVADRTAKGPGTVYLLAEDEVDTGTFSVFLLGQHYLEYALVTMKDYLTNSEGLWFQFKEADGVSVTTTSLQFKSQNDITDFMRALRELKNRKSKTVTPAIQKSVTPEVKAETSSEETSFHTPSQLPTEESFEACPTKVDDKESMSQTNNKSSKETMQIKVESDTDQKPDLQSVPKFEPEQNTAAVGQEAMRDCPLTPSNGGATSTPADDRLSAELLDLSQPAQTPSPKHHRYSDCKSAYALDLVSLDTPVGTDSQSTNAVAGSNSMEMEMEAASGRSENPSRGYQEDRQETRGMGGDDDISTTSQTPGQNTQEMLKGYLLHVLPLFREMKRIIASVEECDRETVARTVFTNSLGEIGRIYGPDKTLTLVAKEILLSLLKKENKGANTGANAAPPTKTPSNGLMYSSSEIMSLRSNVAPDVPQLDELTFLPRRKSFVSLSRPTRVNKTNSAPSIANSDGQLDTASAAAHPAVPKPTVAVANTFADTSQAAAVTAPITHRAASLRTISHNQHATSHVVQPSPAEATLVKTVAAAPPAPAPAPPKKGLGGSRWATGSNGVLPENENHFTGIGFPRRRS